MSKSYKLLFLVLMTAALFFGFMHLFVAPSAGGVDFHRLHIFLFNLCTGSTILLYHSEGGERFSGRVLGFFALSLGYALCAFIEIYPVAIIIAVMLAVIVEMIRRSRFPIVPVDLLRLTVPVAEKFHHAALLCLSLALLMSALVILNNEYLHLVSMAKLQLNTFFLGFSFPVSLITMSVIFALMKDDIPRRLRLLKDMTFWSVNAGVIVFFLFILFEVYLPQVVIVLILFFTVALILYLFLKLGIKAQQKNFLTSGMLFLVFTAITGIIYVALEAFPQYHPANTKLLLRVHAFASLYGWNLSGLAVIFRHQEFPLKLHSKGVIALHWLTVTIMAPLGHSSKTLAIVATACYAAILFIILFSKGADRIDEQG